MPRIIAFYERAMGHDLLRNFAAFGVAELSVRLVRLLTVIVIARQLVPEIVGIAALCLTLFELVRVLANIGVGQKIISCEENLLAATCNSARRIFWLWCGAVAIVQILVAAILAFGFRQILAGQMLAILSLVYIFMPGGLVQCFLLMRVGRASATARIAATQTICDHMLTATLLLIWQSPWSIILPKLITAPIWLLLTRRAFSWRPNIAAGYVPARSLMHFGLSVLVTDMALALRNHFDKIIIAATLGVSALGTYYFAFNAGIGIVASLIAAFGTVIYPSLCAVQGQLRLQKLKQLILIGSAIFMPIIAAQILLAPIYVPLVFGAHWAHAIPLIMILCLASIPAFAAAIATAWLRAEGRPAIDAKLGVVSCIAALSALYLGANMGGLNDAALAWVGGLSLVTIPFAAWVVSSAFSKNSEIQQQEIFS